ncbi:MAG TPA: hypothetical protein VFU15_06170, partial [Bacteroidia bacterium]|nr:hypothetical protein [Bacteroidia bacterium]
MFRFLLFPFFILLSAAGHAQHFSHFLYVHEAAGLNKQIPMAGYSMAKKHIAYNFAAGKASGTDNQSLDPQDIDNINAK